MSKLSHGGEDDLQEMRRKVHTLAEDTAVALKKNVYKNYSQFIETAKEISSILFFIQPCDTLQTGSSVERQSKCFRKKTACTRKVFRFRVQLGVSVLCVHSTSSLCQEIVAERKEFST